MIDMAWMSSVYNTLQKSVAINSLEVPYQSLLLHARHKPLLSLNQKIKATYNQ